MNFDNLLNHPALAGMRAVRQWIVWELKPSTDRPGKMDKVPVSVLTGKPVSAHAPSTWLSITEAVLHAQRLGAGYGVGFTFTDDCGYWFLDLDSCLLPSNEWSPLAHQMCQQFNGAAVEVSISGNGLHLFGRGSVLPHGIKNAEHHAEFYTAGRFCAMTGNGLKGDCNTDHSAMLPWLVQNYFPLKERKQFTVPTDGPRSDWRGETDDDALIERMLNAPPRAWQRFGAQGRASFIDLWTGNVAALSRAFPSSSNSAESYDPSRADASLAQAFAYETGCDVWRIERLMRRSALVRDKWDHRPDYLVERTIMFVCGRQERVRQDPPTPEEVLTQLRAMTHDECRAQAVPLMLRLSNGDVETIIHQVDGLTLHGIRPLRTMLKEGRDHQDRERAEKQIAERAGPRMLIEHRPEACSEQAAQVEALIIESAPPGEYLSFAGALCRVSTKPLPFTHIIDNPDGEAPDAPQLEPLDSVDVRTQVEGVAVFYERRATDAQKPIAVPERLTETLLKRKDSAAPVVNGLLTHPIVLPDGEILSTPGLHERTGLYLRSVGDQDARPYTQQEAASALQRLRATMLDGFEFASQLDADVALAGLFTGVQRRLLSQAPGLAVLAAAQSSGKTTYARRIYLMLTGMDMPAMTFPLDNETEVAKQVLSTLLRSPAMVTFDNVPDGLSFRSGVLAAVMTSGTYDGRVLGVSRDASVPTNTMICMTGNNLTLGPDEITRWMVTRLAPTTARPEERKFSNPDVVGHALAHRAQVLRDVVGVISGFLAAGLTYQNASRFPAWDRMVRQPLCWAGALDVAHVFRVNAEASESTRALRALLWGLNQLFPGRWFKAKEIAGPEFVFSTKEAFSVVSDALAVLGLERSLTSRSVGKKLETLAGRVAEVDGKQMRLQVGDDNHSKLNIYRVEVVPV